jgi:hypothetical protein
MKNDLTTGAWQQDIGCPIKIVLVFTSDASSREAKVGTDWQQECLREAFNIGTKVAGNESVNYHTAVGDGSCEGQLTQTTPPINGNSKRAVACKDIV